MSKNQWRMAWFKLQNNNLSTAKTIPESDIVTLLLIKAWIKYIKAGTSLKAIVLTVSKIEIENGESVKDQTTRP